MKNLIIPIFISHMGCPFNCIFCNQNKISGYSGILHTNQIERIIENHLQTYKIKYSGTLKHEASIKEVAFYGGSFTGIPINQQKEYLQSVQKYIQSGELNQIRLSTRPDYIDNKILKLLKAYNVKTIELGVQSLDDDVLKLSSRGHKAEDVYKAAYLIKENGLELGFQTMIGLPGDTREKAIMTAEKAVEYMPDILRIYPTLVIKDTLLEKLFKNKKYTPLPLEEAVDITAELLDIYYSKRINVIRVGLQPTEEINESAQVIAGPFHPSFRHLAESALMLKKMKKIIEDNKLLGDRIIIYANKYNISNVTGYKKTNILYLKEQYAYSNITIKTANIEKYSIDFSIN